MLGQRPEIIYWAMSLSEDTKLSEERPIIIKGQHKTSYVKDTWRNVRGGNPSWIWLACLKFVSQQLKELSKKLK